MGETVEVSPAAENNDRLSFEDAKKALKDDYNDYTAYYRKNIVTVSYGLIAATWALNSQKIQSGTIDTGIKLCLIFALISIGLRVIFGYCYACLLDARFKSIQHDFETSKIEFKNRAQSRSEYPYTSEMKSMAYFFDGTSILAILIAIFAFLFQLF